ncbi:MAG: type II toxin-antitoxin system HicB family antitoxin [Candidatus Binatia bacterium]
MMPYEINVWWSEADQVFVAEVPELRGCSAHGPTEADAIANVKDAAALWIDVATKAGEPVPPSRTVRH